MKKVLTLIFAFLLAVSLAGCSTDSLGDYHKAAEKTDQVKMGQTSGEISVLMDFNTDGMTAEQIKELNYFKDMKGSFSAVYDDDSEKGIFRNYLNFGGLGFDFDMFMNGDEAFIKLPVIGKYMRLSEMQDSIAMGQEEEAPEFISGETVKALSDKWLELMNKEDVFKGKDIVLTTPDGEVKTTQYTIKLNNEQIKRLIADSADILSLDEKLTEFYNQYIRKNAEVLEDTTLEDMLFDTKKGLEHVTVEDFSYNAYVDIDGYIVNEVVELVFKFDSPEQGNLAGVSYKLDIKNWDLNKEQEFEFPELTDNNTMNMEELDQSMPFELEILLNNKE